VAIPRITPGSRAIILLFVFLTALLGFAGGFYLSILSRPGQPGILPAPKTYTAVQPSIGPLQQTIPAEIALKDGSAFAVTFNIPVSDIPAGADVLLTRVDGTLFTDPGKITGGFIEKGDGERAYPLTLPSSAGEESFVKAQIVIRENLFARRIPLASLVRDDNGSAFVWLLAPGEKEGTEIPRRSAVSVYFEGKDYVDAGDEIRSTDFLIADPDNTLEDGKAVAVQRQALDAPLRTPLEQAREEAYRSARRKIDEDAQAKWSAYEKANGLSCSAPRQSLIVP